MKAIYASKLYKASKRKAVIRAALTNPVNMELVKQLAEYLDEEYVDVNEKPEPAESEPAESKESIRPSESSGGGGGGGFSGGGSFDGGSDGPDLSDMAADVDAERDEALSPEPADVEESHRAPGKAILAAETADDIAKSPDEIKGLLNSRADSTGVMNIAVQDNVLWIYYDEGINLNEVMEPAISLLNAAGYSSLNFQKLSRSDNAMTFQIDEVDSGVRPISDAADK